MVYKIGRQLQGSRGGGGFPDNSVIPRLTVVFWVLVKDEILEIECHGPASRRTYGGTGTYTTLPRELNFPVG